MTPPTKPTDTFRRAYRGGSWGVTSATIVRAACRNGDPPSHRSYRFGFRCAQRGCRQQVLEA